MTKYQYIIVLFLSFILLLTCGKKKNNPVGSIDHQIETMRTYDDEIYANGITTTKIEVEVYNIDGTYADSQKVVFNTTYGTIDDYAITDHWGYADVILTSIASKVDLVAKVTATVVRTHFNNLPKNSSQDFYLDIRVAGTADTLRSLQRVSKTKLDSYEKTINVKFIGITIDVSIGDSVISGDGLSEEEIKVELRKSSKGLPVLYEKVFLTTKYGKIPGEARTDNDGNAIVKLTAGTKTAEDTVWAVYGRTDGMVVISDYVPIRYVSPYLKLTSEYNRLPADGESKIELVTRLLSYKNTPIRGAVIYFSTTNGIVEPMATTDKYGIATVELFASKNPDSDVTVIAKFLQLADTIKVAFGSTNISNITFYTDDEPVLRDGVATKEISLLAINELDQPVSYMPINLSVDYGYVPDTVITNKKGYATFEYIADDENPVTNSPSKNFDVRPGRLLKRSRRIEPLSFQGNDKFKMLENLTGGSTDITAKIVASAGNVEVFHEIELLGINFQIMAIPDSIPADGVSTSNIQAVVKQASTNIAVTSHLITFATDYGTIPTSAITNNQGIASVYFTSGITSELATVVANCGTIKDTTSVYLFKNSPAKIEFVKDSEPVLRDGVSTKTIGLYVKDGLDKPVPNVTVNLNVNPGRNPDPEITNNIGYVEFEYIPDANYSNTKATVTASAGTVRETKIVQLIGLRIGISVDPDSLIADGQSSSTVRVEVKQDSTNIAITDYLVGFSSNLGTIIPSKITDIQGVAIVSYTAGTAAETANITATCGKLSNSAQIELIAQKADKIQFEPGINPILRDGQASAPICFHVLDKLNQPVPNVFVNLNASYGEVPNSVYTDDQGYATFDIKADHGNTTVNSIITATAGSVIGTQTIELQGIIIEVSSTPDSIVADGTSQSEIRVKLKLDQSNLAVTNYPVRFASSLGTITPSADTDALGVAVAAFTSGITSGNAIITIICGELSKQDSVYLVGDVPNDILLQAESNYIWVKETGKNEQSLINATVVGTSGQPVINEVGVQFEIIKEPGGGVYIEPSSDESLLISKVIKTVNGIATANVRSGIRAGTMQIQARLVERPEIVAQTTNIVIRSGPPYMWQLGESDPDSVISHVTLMVEPGKHNVGFANPVQDISISVLFGDKYNNPVEAGTAVYFTTTGGVISTDAVTDESGAASVTLNNGNPFPKLVTDDPYQWGAHSIPNPNHESSFLDIYIPDLEGGVIKNSENNFGQNDGVSVIFAYAWGKDQDNNDVKVWGINRIVYSVGIKEFSADASSYWLEAGQSSYISIRLYDQRGNPVAAGSSLTASTTAGELSATSLMPAAEGYGFGSTYWNTTLVNNYNPEDSVLTTAAVSLDLTSVNGSGTITLPAITLRAFP